MTVKSPMDSPAFANQDESNPMKIPSGVNTNTYMSVALVAMLIGGFWAVLTALYGSKAEIMARLDKGEWNQTQMRSEINELKERKGTQETWDFQRMFKWSVHLQKDNPQIKVPEPEDNP